MCSRTLGIQYYSLAVAAVPAIALKRNKINAVPYLFLIGSFIIRCTVCIKFSKNRGCFHGIHVEELYYIE
jgi:hypothetical protein